MNDILQLTIILAFALVATIMSRRMQIPEVVGQMLVGILLSPAILGWVHGGHTIDVMAEIGVILLMFLAGLESDVKLLKHHFKPALGVALSGIMVPLIVFTLVILGTGNPFSTSFFYGIVFAATSVSITVKVLQEYGKLATTAGNIILGAAVIDDVLAILILAVYTSFSTGKANLIFQFSMAVIFFVFLFLVYRFLPNLWRFIDKLPVYAKHTTAALLICLGLSLLADSVGMSAVIGSFFAGLAISQTEVAKEIEQSISTIGYVIFIPIFFVSIALTINFESLVKHPFLIIMITVIAILTKCLPAYYAGRLSKLSKSDALLIGTGMVSRGEMALIIAQIGISSALISRDVYSELVIAIILTTFIAPFLIKASLKRN
ncbi:cation:proton antiporter [Lactococcus piscium]|uniref:cation:proton antiporter n=1 Tax=Pseudolactococcus carnosus TaxID=2749961 RepID=UPI001FB9FF04|nr:cation:proton antiporter [Lactococcus carnosus]MCJ1995862.1 cation:proton antiporter [Lactococcus carnosus]